MDTISDPLVMVPALAVVVDLLSYEDIVTREGGFIRICKKKPMYSLHDYCRRRVLKILDWIRSSVPSLFLCALRSTIEIQGHCPFPPAQRSGLLETVVL